LRSINAAHSLAAGYEAVERNRTPHSIALSRRGERPVFAWGIVSRFAEPSQRWGLFFPLATFVVSGEFTSSRQAPLPALLGGTRVLGARCGHPSVRTVSATSSALCFAGRSL
jgi:hypothetical protein